MNAAPSPEASRPTVGIFDEASGPLLNALHARMLGPTAHHDRSRLAALVVVVLGIPLFALAAAQGPVLTTAPPDALRWDFGVYARLFVVIPSVLLASATAERRLSLVASQFERMGLVPPEAREGFAALGAKIRRWGSSWVLDVGLFAACVGLSRSSLDLEYASTRPEWTLVHDAAGDHPSLAVLWYATTLVPVTYYVIFRALWTWVLWARFLYGASRLPLRVSAMHPDRNGGLAFVAEAPLAFSPVVFAVASLLAATWAHRMYFHAVPLHSLQVPCLIFASLALTLFLAPPLVFLPLLARARLTAIMEYGRLASEVARTFDERWMREGQGEGLFATNDASSFSDFAAAFEGIRRMRPVPSSTVTIVVLVIAAALPMIPMALTVMPLTKLLANLVSALR